MAATTGVPRWVYRALTLSRKLDLFARFDVVVLDELGYVPFDKQGADLLFGFITRVYERRSLIVTTTESVPMSPSAVSPAAPSSGTSSPAAIASATACHGPIVHYVALAEPLGVQVSMRCYPHPPIFMLRRNLDMTRHLMHIHNTTTIDTAHKIELSHLWEARPNAA